MWLVENIATWLLALIATTVGMTIGVLLCLYTIRRADRKRRMIPKRWPLNPRVLANSQERRVWRWLIQTFFDHHVMVKLPVIRFTLLRTREQGLHWYKLLSGVHCTFTICRSDGRVVGCVDLLGPNGLSRSNRHLKQTLLLQCGISYWVLEPDGLPTAEEIRTEFLGEAAALTHPPEPERDEAMIAAARQNLSATLERQRRSRNSDVSPITSGYPLSPGGDPENSRTTDSNFPVSSEFGSGWHQQNSFLTPLDSRRSELR